MQELVKKIESLDLKTRQVLHKIELLKKENKNLLEENTKLKQERNRIKEEFQTIVEKEKGHIQENLKAINGQEAERLKEKIDLYISEIDACIEMLK